MWMTLARGPRQLVVQEALLDNLEGIVVILLVVHADHKHGGIAEGTEMMTLLAPPFK